MKLGSLRIAGDSGRAQPNFAFGRRVSPLRNSTCLARNFILLAAGEFAGKLFGFVAFAYLARVLGPEEFGQLEFALALIFFLTLFVDCGLSAYGAREIAKGEIALNRLTFHIIVLRCLFAAVGFIVLVVLVALLEKLSMLRTLLLLYGLTLFALPTLLPFVFQGRELMRYVATASVIRWSLFAAGVFLFIREPGGIWIVPLIEAGAIVCVSVFYVSVFLHYFGSLRQGIDWRWLGVIWRQALPLGASELVWALKIFFATVLLGILLHGPEVGWFAAAHRVVISLHTFVWLYFFNLLPAIARSTKGPSEEVYRLIRISMQVTALGGALLAVAGTLFARPIITLVYGSQYHEAIPVFQVLIWLVPLALMSGHFRYLLIGYNRQDLEFLSAACGAALNVGLNILLTGSYGAQAGAWALIASEIAIWGLASFFVRVTITHIPIWPFVLQPLIGGGDSKIVTQVRSMFVRQR
jgi:O-antigen/teichoic acid export membrane protein